MIKVDYKKTLKSLYSASTERVDFVDVPAFNFVSVKGKGDPQAKLFQNAIKTLYAVAYKIKFAVKKTKEFDYVVPPLQCLWWADDVSDFSDNNRHNWQWQLLIMQPQIVDADVFKEVIEVVATKKNALIAIDEVCLQNLTEGKCAQTLHIGSFREVDKSIARLHSTIKENGHTLTGKYHEIYMSDFRRVTPDRYRTIIRQPMLREV